MAIEIRRKVFYDVKKELKRTILGGALTGLVLGWGGLTLNDCVKERNLRQTETPIETYQEGIERNEKNREGIDGAIERMQDNPRYEKTIRYLEERKELRINERKETPSGEREEEEEEEDQIDQREKEKKRKNPRDLLKIKNKSYATNNLNESYATNNLNESYAINNLNESYATNNLNDDCDKMILARLIYGEARNCSLEEQIAVAFTVVNRANDGKKWNGETIKESALAKWQYSCFNENDPNRNKLMNPNPKIFRNCLNVANGVLEGFYEYNLGATHYHTKGTSPSWASKIDQVQSDGSFKHIFYIEK